jgi:hypothetical protein
MSRYDTKRRLSAPPDNIVANWFVGGRAVGDFESIATVTLGASQTTVTFASIPQTYKHLQIRAISKYNTVANSDDYGIVQFNSDTNYLNYASHFLYGDGATAASTSVIAASTYPGAIIFDSPLSGASQTSVFGSSIIDILDYTNTNKNKTTRSLSGWDANGIGWVQFTSGLWLSTAAISSIVISQKGSARDFVQYSHFALYGLKG